MSIKKYFPKPGLQGLTLTAEMIGLEIVFERMLKAVDLPLMRISLGFLPIAVLAVYLGPLYASFAWAAADVIGFFIFPSGFPYFPGFTASAFISGMIFGFILYKNGGKIVRTVVASGIVCIADVFFLRLLWLRIMMRIGNMDAVPMEVTVAARAIQVAIIFPVQCIFIYLVGVAIKKVKFRNIS